MIQQLDIFSLPTQSSSSKLPKAIIPIDPKVEAALNSLLELKELALSQFQIGSRIIAGDLHGAIASINDELAQVLFDGEFKARPVFLDSLTPEWLMKNPDTQVKLSFRRLKHKIGGYVLIKKVSV